MCGKWRYVGSALVVALGVAVLPLHAQRGQGTPGQGLRGRGGPNMGYSLELALENEGELGLTQDQVAELQELKAIIDGDVAGLAEEMEALRASIQSGEVERDEGFRQLTALRGELITASAPLRGRIQEVLTVEQHYRLQPLVWQSRADVGRAGVGRVGVGRAGVGRGGASMPGIGRNGAPQGRGAPSAQGRGFGLGRGGVGMPGQLSGNRSGIGFRPGFNGQGRDPALGFGQVAPGVRRHRMANPAPYHWRGRGGGSPAAPGEGMNLP